MLPELHQQPMQHSSVIIRRHAGQDLDIQLGDLCLLGHHDAFSNA